jgi:peptide/nickel transport system substrate-binding protein
MYNPAIDIIDFNLDKASALLDEAGWRLSEDDGWRYKEIDGQPVKLEFDLTIPRESSTSPKIAAVFAQDLKKIGVSMKTQVLEWAAFQKKIRSHDFQAEIAGWGTGTDPDSGWNLWRTEEYENGRNYGGYSNAQVDKLFEQGRAEFDPEKRAMVYQEIQKVIYEDQPYIFLFNSQTLWAVHKRIRGVQFSPRGLFGFDPGDTAWWVSKDEMLRP